MIVNFIRSVSVTDSRQYVDCSRLSDKLINQRGIICTTRNYRPLSLSQVVLLVIALLDWQVHVYGAATPEIQRMCGRRKLPLHVFTWHTEMSRSGLERNALYLVRPDGYVALADSSGDATRISSYLDKRKLLPEN